nr:MAG TPA: hypothetical protein [Caudoviricetes sp.]
MMIARLTANLKKQYSKVMEAVLYCLFPYIN